MRIATPSRVLAVLCTMSLVTTAKAQKPSIRVMPYPHLKRTLGRDPLPMQHTWQRLLKDGVKDAAQYVKKLQAKESHRLRLNRYRQESLVITWDGAPDARWALNVEGRMRSLTGNRPYYPRNGWARHRWERKSDRNCTLIYESDKPKASLRVTFHVKKDHVVYELTLKADEPTPKRLATHLCFNHCWAGGFGRDALVWIDGKKRRLGDIPNPKRIWIRVATLADKPLYGKLKRDQFAQDGFGGNLNDAKMTGVHAVAIKIPVGGVQGRLIATERRGNRPATVAINSPDAISVGWSFWPCTDIDLALGAVRPGKPKTISGRIYFLNAPSAVALKKIRIGQKRRERNR